MPEIMNKQKAPKDILLNSILHEIDEENGVLNQVEEPIDVPKPKKKSKQKKEQHPLLRALFYFLSTMIVLFLMFMIVMITLVEDETQERKKEEASISSVEEKSKEFVPKKVYHFEDFSKTFPLKEEGNTIVGSMQKKPQVKGKEAKESRRKTAKEALLEQMQK